MKIGSLYINEDKIVTITIQESLLIILLTNQIIKVCPSALAKYSENDNYLFVSAKEFKQLKENIELRYT